MNGELSALAGSSVPHRELKRWRAIDDDDVPDGDVVVATWWETASWVAALSPSKGAKAYFAQDYGAHAGQPMDAVAETWRLPLHKITISRWMLELIRSHSEHDDISLVPNAVDLEQFHAPPRKRNEHFTVGLAYSAREQKGMDIARKAIDGARNELNDLRVVAFGPHEPTEHLPLPPDTTFHLRAPESELAAIYSACDAWLFTSRVEGFGLPILEAMACRTPVIATPAGAAPEILEQGGGCVVPHEDPEAMADAIITLARLSADKWRAMSNRAREIVAACTWRDASSKFERALRHAIESQRPVAERHSDKGASAP